MLELYDDRVKQVVPNEGLLVEDIARSKRQVEVHIFRVLDSVDIRWPSRILYFSLGVIATCIVFQVIFAFAPATKAERKLYDAVQEYLQSKGPERAEGLLK